MIFSPEFSGYSVAASAASEIIGHAAHLALSLERTTAELADARAQLRAIESERDQLATAQAAPSAEAEPAREDQAATSPAEQTGLKDGAEVVIFDRREAVELKPTPPAAPPPLAEQKPSREETRHLSRLAQSEIIREIITHENFTHNGRLEAHNISATVRGLVQARTGMSDKQWVNTWSTLRQNKSISLRTYKDRPKRAHTVVVDMERVAAAIEKEELFSEEGDKLLRELILERVATQTTSKASITPEERAPKLAPPTAPRPPAPKAATPPASPAPPKTQKPSPPKTVAPPATSAPKTVLAQQAKPPSKPEKSGRQIRQERYEEKQRKGGAAASREAEQSIASRQRSQAEELVEGDKIVLPDYAKVSDEEWAASPDEVRLLLALINDRVSKDKYKTSEQLLSGVVEAGRISLKDDKGDHDPKKLPSLIKALRNIPSPKIKFYKTDDGDFKLKLTQVGEEYLVTQFRKVRQEVIETKLAQTKARKASKAA